MKRTAFLIALVCIALVSPASPRTWYITPDGTGDAPTIQAGCDSTASEDTVLVAAGTYHENIWIDRIGDYRAVYLISESGPTSTTVIGDASLPVIATSSGFSRIEGFGLEGGSEGIYCNFTYGVIVGNIVWGSRYYGIHVFSPDAWIDALAQIEGNIVYDAETGISLAGAAWPGTRFASNTVFDCETGIHINNANGSAVQVFRNIVSGCSWAGIHQNTECEPYSCPPPILECNVVWGNHRNYRGTEPGDTDMLVCPMLCYAHLADFRVCYDSPCLPENNPYGCHVGACGAGCECGPTKIEETTWGAIKAIYR